MVNVTVTPNPVTLYVNQQQTWTASYTTSGCTPGAVSYQWYKDGTLVSGATNSSYTTSFSGAGGHTVSCTVTVAGCGAGSGMSAVTVVQGGGTVTVTISPGAPSICTNTNQTFTATYTTSGCTPGAVSYQWSVDSTPVQGATSSTYTTSWASAGTHTVSCSVTVAGCGSGTGSSTVTVTTCGTVTVTVSPASVTLCVGQSQTWTASYTTSGCTPGSASYQWKLNGADIAGATSSTYTRSFDSAGSNTLACVVAVSGCGSGTGTAGVTVNNCVSASVTPATAALCLGQSQTFTVSYTTPGCTPGSVACQWAVDGSAVPGATNSTYTTSFTATGGHTVACTVTVIGCGSATATSSVTVNNCCEVTIVPASGTICVGATQTWTAVVNTSGCTPSTVAYQWSLDGTPVAGATGATYATSFGATGSHTVSCAVTATGCGSGTGGASVTVSNTCVTASVTPASASLCRTQSQTFTASYTTTGCTPGAVSYQWVVDGSPVGGATNSTYATSFATTGNHAVSCVVSVSGCGSGTGTSSVSVTNCVTATVTPANPSLCIGQAQTFTATFETPNCTPGVATYQWWVDGSAVTGATDHVFTTSFAATGSHDVRCVVTVSGCGSATGTAQPTVANGAVTNVQASATPDKALVGQTVDFAGSAQDTCPNAVLTYTWDFGDGSPTASGQNVQHAYAAPKYNGNGELIPYTATLTVTDQIGGQGSDQVEVTVEDASVARPGPGEQPFCLACMLASEKGSVAAGMDVRSANAHFTFADPIATRGYPITVNVSLDSQAVETNRPMGNGTFTYDIHVGTQTVYDASFQPSTHWVLVDGDGTRHDFGLASGNPAPPAGVHCQLTVLPGGVGYTVQNAGPPESIGQAGSFAYTFDSAGRLLQLTDPQGNVQQLTYSGGAPTQILDVSTQKAVTFVNSGGRISQIVSGGGQSRLVMGYTSDRVTSVAVQDAQGVIGTRTDLTYNADGSIATLKRDNDAATMLSFSYTQHPAADGVSLVPYANASWTGGGTSVQYKVLPGAGAVASARVTNAKGGAFQYDFDAVGNLIRVTTPQLTGATQPTAYTFGYDASRNLTGAAVNGTSVATLGYTANGLLSSLTDALSHTWSATYNGVDLTSATDPLGPVGSITYGNPLQPHVPTLATDAASLSWSFAHNAHGQITSVTPPTGSPMGAVTVTYDETPSSPTLGYPLAAANANGDIVTFDAYSPLGDLLAFSTYPVTGNPNVKNTTLFSFDPAQRLTGVQHPDGHSAGWFYSGRNLDHVIDEAGARYDYSYCLPCGTLTGVSGPLNWSLSVTLDGDKDVTAFTDARSKVTQYAYGLAGELTGVTYPDGSGLGVLYDNAGRVRDVVNSRGQHIALGYDAADRLLTMSFPTTGSPTISYAYNADDSLESVTDAAGLTSFTYTATGQVATVTYDYSASGLAPVQQLEYSYHPDGSRAGLTWRSGGIVVGTWTYAYDAGGRLVGVTNGWGETTAWTFDGEDKLKTQTNANGSVLTVGYNEARGWPTSLAWLRGGTTIASYGLVYDNGANTVGNLTGVADYGGGTASFAYDALYRLTAEARTGGNANSYAHQYDLAGNRTSVDGGARVHDNANKLTSYVLNGSTYAVTHNADGDVTGASGPGDVYGFTWNDLDQMIGQTRMGPPVTYKYDGLGRRVYLNSLYRGQVYHLFDGDLLLGEVTLPTGGQATLTAAYTWGAGGLVSERLVSQGRSLWYHFGPQGETRQLTNASGSVVDTYVYTAYGLPVASTGTDPNPFRFGGQVGYYTETNPQCQTVLCGARWYSPVLGRWLSRDPIGYEGGPNLYEYCQGDPVGGIDPDGASWEDVKRWYHGGMGGFSDWVDRTLGFGFAAGWGDVAGLHDSGRASGGAVVWGGLKFSGMLVYNAVSVTRGASGLPIRLGLPGCAARAGGAGGGPAVTAWRVAPAVARVPGGLRGASPGLKALYAGGSLRGQTIIGVRAVLLRNGFRQGIARTRNGYLFRNAAGEQVRIMRRHGGWDARVMNRFGGYLDDVGNQATGRAASHGIALECR